jgi:hypothetical protein
VGFLAGAILVASGLMHSLLGWREMRAAFSPTGAPPDLVAGLAVPWHFAGFSMVNFGALVISGFLGAARHHEGSLRAPRIIALAYVAFALGGATFIKLDPTFLLFLVPGAMVLAVSA